MEETLYRRLRLKRQNPNFSKGNLNDESNSVMLHAYVNALILFLYSRWLFKQWRLVRVAWRTRLVTRDYRGDLTCETAQVVKHETS
jgi:hypothetical protein